MLRGPRPTDEATLTEAAWLATEHDRRADGRFPDAAWSALERAGITAATVEPVPAAEELGLVRAVSRADVSLGRLLDGHFNAVERLRVQVDPELAAAELAGVRSGALRLGVWGADPIPGEGHPAELHTGPDGDRLTGTKVFCSGAGGLHRAFVLCREPRGTAPSQLAYVDLTGRSTRVDRDWFRGAGMRGSASHRVDFAEAAVLWRAREAGALMQEPWFSGDAVRTAASWVGGLDTVAEETRATLVAKGATGELEALALARVETARQTAGLWLAEAARRIEAGGADRALTAHLRDAVSGALRDGLDASAAAVGSRPFATGTPLERARRDLETYVLQHRLEPILVRAGRAALEAG